MTPWTSDEWGNLYAPSLIQFGYHEPLLAPPPPRGAIDWFGRMPRWYADMLRAAAHLGVYR